MAEMTNIKGLMISSAGKDVKFLGLIYISLAGV